MLDDFNNIFRKVFEVANKQNAEQDGDYRDEEGFLMCGKCHTRKEIALSDGNGGTMNVGYACDCRRKAIEEQDADEAKKKHKEIVLSLQQKGISNGRYRTYTFDTDDMKNPKSSNSCKRYVDNWKDMYQQNIGLLFCGSVGTGKSFLACCIANALIEKYVKVCVTDISKLLNQLFNAQDKQKVIDDMNSFDLVIIDDLGVERNTPYAAEQLQNIINARSIANKPLIVTTNLSVDEMRNQPSIELTRAYDRVLEMCQVHIQMTGESRRAANALTQKEKALKILKGEI